MDKLQVLCVLVLRPVGELGLDAGCRLSIVQTSMEYNLKAWERMLVYRFISDIGCIMCCFRCAWAI